MKSIAVWDECHNHILGYVHVHRIMPNGKIGRRWSHRLRPYHPKDRLIGFGRHERKDQR